MLLHWIREIVNHMNEDTAFIHIDYSRVFAKTIYSGTLNWSLLFFRFLL
jgi:hypothetical protein